ncbi:MAG: hypothetical protein OEU76_01370, partial [Cyclobacteriaceae bacterium]|nr:hypothetical protein [Cyclobacteriaceae bacterium]
MRGIYFITILIFVWGTLGVKIAQAQQPMSVKINNSTVCYAHTKDNPCYVPPPEEFKIFLNGARKKSSTIEVNYNPGFSPEAEAAFSYAIDIWESLISSPVPIKIEAYWSSLNPGTLGGANFTSAWANFSGAQKLNVFYPIALAEKITGENLNGNEPEIFIQFNNTANWHYNPDTAPAAGQYDIITVLLHEIGHGLGFSGAFKVTGTTGNLAGAPYAYDVPIENHLLENLIRNYQSPSTDLGAQLTGSNLFSNTFTSNRPKLYAPATWSDGSSISHVDENTYNNSADALMTPQIAPSERIHSPGVALNMLKDIGWEMVRLDHQRIIDRENVVDPFIVTTKLVADNGYNPGSVILRYTTNGGTTFTAVNMTPTGTPDEYTGTIPSTGSPQQYGYYISVNDNVGREFVNPGKIVRKLNTELQSLFNFETGPDVIEPLLTHSPKPFLLDTETSMTLEARVSDNIGVGSVMVEFSINNVIQTPQALLLTPPEKDSIYSMTLNLGPLTVGDEIKYKIIATDNSSNSNQSVSPKNDFYFINVVHLEPTQDSYFNDFNTPSGHFAGNGFNISQASGFDSPAINTTHPYLEGTGFPNDQINFIYQLNIPIRIKQNDATLIFDEIVLVEPGEPGTGFGQEDFFDYVVVEGSKDGGVTWTPVASGYDSRDNSAWLTRYNSAISGNNSTAVGDPSLYRQRNLNLQNRFSTGDEVVIRFRLFSDPFAAGWGWAIDNLKIQIDDTPPLILNDH